MRSSKAGAPQSWRRSLGPLVMALAGLGIPAAVAGLLHLPDPGSAVGLAGLAAMVATYLLGWRIGLAVAVVLAVGIPLLSAASGHALVACLGMAAIGAAYGMSAVRGWQGGLLLVPITLGFAVSDPARASQMPMDLVPLAQVGLVSGVGALASVGLVQLVTGGQQPAGQGKVSTSRASGFAAMVASAAAITTAIAVIGQWHHAGGWLIMTPFLVLQPYLRDALSRSAKRGLGTILGFAVSFAIAAVLNQGWVIYALGIGCAALTLYALQRHWDYAVYTAALTVSIILIQGAGTSIEQTGQLRLAATIIGVLISLAIMVVANPVYRAAIRRRPKEVGP